MSEEKTKMTKFEKDLSMSHKDIKGKRAKIFTTDAKIDSENFIRNLTEKKREIEKQIFNLEDFHVDSTTSLKVTTAGFDSADWVEKLNDLEVKLILLEQRIIVANKIHDKWFN